MITKEEVDAYNKLHSPAILKRMGWSYYDTESAARQVAQFADAALLDLLDYVKGNKERPPTLFGVEEKLNFLLKP